MFQGKHFADIYQIKNHLNLSENMTAGSLPDLSMMRYLMSVPAVNSVPESAGCPCAHQRRVPPASPAFPRSSPLSGPHPQRPGPSRVSPGPSCPSLSALSPPGRRRHHGHRRKWQRGTSARTPLRSDANRKSLPKSSCPHLSSHLCSPAGERRCQPGVPPSRGSALGWALPSVPESLNPKGVRLERTVGHLIQPPCSARPSQSTAWGCIQAALEYPQ